MLFLKVPAGQKEQYGLQLKSGTHWADCSLNPVSHLVQASFVHSEQGDLQFSEQTKLAFESCAKLNPNTQAVHWPLRQLEQPAGHLVHYPETNSNPSTQLRQTLMFLGSQVPLQLFKHFTHLPFSLRPKPKEHERQVLGLLASHYKQPLWHAFMQSFPDRENPLLQERHDLGSEARHVLQFPWHYIQLFCESKFKLSKHLLHVVLFKHSKHPPLQGIQRP